MHLMVQGKRTRFFRIQKFDKNSKTLVGFYHVCDQEHHAIWRMCSLFFLSPNSEDDMLEEKVSRFKGHLQKKNTRLFHFKNTNEY